MTVPSLSVTCMIIEAVLAFAIPLTAIIIWKVKSKASIVPAIGGALTFVLFAQMLEGSVHALLLSSENPFSNLMSTNFFLYALYGGLMAGIFEETGRYITMKFVLKNYNSKSDAVSYGLGHGGIECILVLGFNMLANIAFAVLVNSGAGESVLLPMAGGSTESLATIVSSLSEVTPALAAVAVFERVCAMALQLCLSVMVFSAVKKNVLNYLLAAILIHALADFSILMVSQYAGIYFAEAVLAVFVAAAAYYVFKVKKGEV